MTDGGRGESGQDIHVSAGVQDRFLMHIGSCSFFFFAFHIPNLVSTACSSSSRIGGKSSSVVMKGKRI